MPRDYDLATILQTTTYTLVQNITYILPPLTGEEQVKNVHGHVK